MATIFVCVNVSARKMRVEVKPPLDPPKVSQTKSQPCASQIFCFPRFFLFVSAHHGRLSTPTRGAVQSRVQLGTLHCRNARANLCKYDVETVVRIVTKMELKSTSFGKADTFNFVSRKKQESKEPVTAI